MKNTFSFLVETRALLRAVRCIKRYVPAREKASVRKSIWLSVVDGHLKVELDADARIAKFLPVENLYEASPQPVAVSADLFLKVLSRCPEKIQIFFTFNKFQVIAENISLVLPFIGPEWYFPENGALVPSSAEGLSKIIDAVARVYPSANMDPDMDAVHCVHFALTPGMLLVEALNGFMYQRVEIELDASTSAAAFILNGAMLPYPHAKRLTEIFRSGFLGEGLGMWLTGTKANPKLFIFGQDGSITLPLQTREYPDSDKFLQLRKNVKGSLTVRQQDIVFALRMMLPTMHKSDRGVYFSALPDSLRLITRTEMEGASNTAYIAPFEVSGDLPNLFAVPEEMLLSLIARSSSPNDDLKFELTASEGPIFISASSRPEALNIIMPLKVSGNYSYDIPEGATAPEHAEAKHAEVA
ncbi:MAG: hypothetical protein EOM66_04930 [Clostridia bacterium]|nr:hypothetical protein [Clostridia bacterium]